MLPRPERDIVEAGKKRVRAEPEVRRAKARRLKGEGGDEPEGEEELEASEDLDEEDVTEISDSGPDAEEPAKSGRTVPNFPLKN